MRKADPGRRERATKDPEAVGARRRVARYVVGALCAALALYASVVNIDWTDLAGAFGGASVPWTLVAAGSVLITLTLVTFRWSLLVGPGQPATGPVSLRWRVLWDSVVVGQAVNIVVPLRFGEGARLAITSRGLAVPVGRVMVGLALERAFDVAAFAAIVFVLIVSGWMPMAFRGLLPAAITVTVLTIGITVVLVRSLPPILGWLRTRFAIVGPTVEWIARQESAMRDGWTEITARHQLISMLVLTALIPVTAAVTNFLVLKSFDLPVPVVTSFVLLVVLQLGTAVVSVPGNVGVFHYLTVVTLAAWDVPQPIALATAIVLHLVTLGPKIILSIFSARSHF